MSRNDPTEVLVAVHHNRPEKLAVLVSINGENARGKWVARAHIKSFHETGKTTLGSDQFGNKVMLPLANMVVPEWLAVQEGLI